jgi:predicted nucleotide-binding protein
MNKTAAGRLLGFVDEGKKIEEEYEFERWSTYVKSFITTAVGSDAADRFDSLSHWNGWPNTLALRLGHLEGLVASWQAVTSATASDYAMDSGKAQLRGASPAIAVGTRRVFVVHGHDDEAKETVSRFLSRLDLEPVILHEQASGGRTIIEKFETYSSDVAFAVVLLTPDDIGGSALDPTSTSKRARQNVILELGYFMGRLGRTRVCALHRGRVELPSDYQGVVYVEMDKAGGWKTRLAQELIGAKVSIDLNGLVNA